MKFYIIYILLLIIRFIINFKSQPGYIHPDEFFQTVEISAGEVLNVQVDSPWEFNAKSPIRSKAVIELFLNIPLKFYFKTIFPFLPISYDYLTICRLWTTVCSLIIDYSIYTVSVATNVNIKLSLFLHASSHISLVFFSRTFSNTWETQLFSLFLIVFIKATPLTSEILQGAIIAIGVFCRPTFPIFVLAIIFHRLLSMQIYKIIKYFLCGCCGFIPVAIVLIVFDSLKYQQKLTLTPLNFLFYNSDHSNFIHHGIHSWYVHVLVNLPLILGVLSTLVILTPFLSHRNKHVKHLFIYVMFPVIGLSLFPHQEMRFLLPIFPLAVVLVSGIVMGSRVPRSIIAGLLTLHLLFSVVSVTFWGFLHEGGIHEATELTRYRMHNSDAVVHTLLSYRTFLVPRFMLASPCVSIHCESPGSFNYSIINLMGIPESNFWDQVFIIANRTLMDAIGSGTRQLHLIYPKAYVFEHSGFFKQIGTLTSNVTIRGHINTDLWPPQVPLADFFSLQYLVFSLNN